MELIDHELVNQLPIDPYTVLDKTFKSGFFAGYLIKSLYDEKRFLIHKKHQPKKLLFNSNNGLHRLYGLVKTVGGENRLINQLIQTPPQNIGEYSSILAMNKLSCLHCFLHFSPGLYPVDNIFVDKIFPELSLEGFRENKNIPPFQRIGHIYLFALINHKLL